MRTNIDIENTLIEEVCRLGHYKTKKAAVESALKDHLNWLSKQALLSLRGKIKWEGSLSAMRKNRLGNTP